MLRRAILVLSAACLVHSGTARADILRARASVQVEEQVGINLSGNVALRSPYLSGVAAGSVLAVTGPSPASLVVSGGPDDAISFSFPDLLDLNREGGLETLQLRLNGNGSSDGTTLLSSSGGVSVRLTGDVGAPVNPVVPGEYGGLLVIVAQWN